MTKARWGVVTAIAAALTLTAIGVAGGSSGDARRAANDPVIGVVPQRSFDPADLERMRKAGIESVRIGIPWSNVERDRDTYDWSAVDHLVRLISSEGLNAFPTLSGTPEWAARRDGYECDGFDCIPFAPASIETRFAFARFAGAAVERYGQDGAFWEANPDLDARPIGAWQIWNEQNSQSFYMPDADPIAYAEVVKRAAAAIHGADPDADVVLGGMFGPHSSSRLDGAARYLREVYEVPGIRDSFEGFALHPYSSTTDGVFSQVRAALRVVRRHGDGADLWITEIGWASSGDPDERLVTDRKGQARLLRKTLSHFTDHAGSWRLRGIWWYAWSDTRQADAVCAWCAGAGLVTRSGSAKPSFAELRRIAQRH